MAADLSEYLKFLISLLAIVNPFGVVPVFVTMTAHQSDADRSRTGRITAMTVAAVLFIALMLGESILHFFSISLASFRVGGGILVLLIAVSMLHAKMSPAKQNREEARDMAEREQVAVVPLGIPLLAGPGAISTIILYAARYDGWGHYAALTAVIGLVAVIVWIAVRSAPLLAQALGRTGINVMTRIMGLILAAIAVEFMANGIKQLLPGLAG